MRIGIDATCLPPVAAGTSRYITGLIRGLASVDTRNEYFIFLKAHDRNFLTPLPTNIRPVLLPNFSRPLRLIYQHFIAATHAHRLRLDVWHGTHYGLPHFTRRLRLISTFHDLSFVEFPTYFSASKRVYFRRALADAARRAEAIVCVSHATREALHRHFPVNGRALTVHSGVEPIFFHRVAAEEIQRVGQRWNIDRPYLLFLGTVENHKNLPLALRAFAILRQRHGEKIHLVIAGQRGSGWPKAQAVIRELHLENAVRSLGYVAEAELPALYQGARLLVLPSIVEGFGFPVLEAMAGGVLVLAARTKSGGAPAELVNHPQMLCEHDAEQWTAKMEKLAYDEPLRRELAAYAVDRARQFSWTTTAQRMVELYESIGQTTPQQMMIPLTSVGMPTAHYIERKNGKARHGGLASASSLVIAAVLRTLIYADLFDYPLLLQEAHLGLLGCAARLEEVNAALGLLQRRRLISRTGDSWHLHERHAIVAERRRRREHTRKLWQQNARVLRFVSRFPFIKNAALSGASSFENCQATDDIDLFIIADGRRLWLTYAALVIILKVLGKRRLICLNYLIGHENLTIPPGRDRDFFVAHQIAFLRPLRGREVFQKFFRANRWIHQYLPQTASQCPAPPAGLPIADENSSFAQRAIEGFFGLRFFDILERTIYRLYSRRITRLAGHLGPEAVEVSPTRIKLFTNNYRHRLSEILERRFAEAWKNYTQKIDVVEIPAAP